MKILRVLNVGETLQKGDYCLSETGSPGKVINKDMGLYARTEEIKDVSSTSPVQANIGSLPKNKFFPMITIPESIPMEPDMSKKCENLNMSREVEIFVPKGQQQNGDKEITLVGNQTLFFRKITLPAPLTPIAFEKRYPYQSAWIFVWSKKDKKWNDTFWDSQHSRHSDDMTHWLPMDALPMPSVDKSLADELEDWAANINTGNCSHATTEIRCDLLKRAAKELRK